MRNPLEHTPPSQGEKRVDMMLWTGLLLGPLAMGVNTIVGYTVAHWTCDTNQKKFSYLVSGIDIAVCLLAISISWAMHRQLNGAGEDSPIDGRRTFMAKIAILLSMISLLLIVAQTINLIMLHPCD